MAREGLPADRLSDQALLMGLREGGPEAGLAFVRRFQRYVYGVALAVVDDPTLAEDLAQQTFERAWGRAASFDSARGTVKAWLAAIAHNLAVDSLRRAKLTPIDPADLVRLFGSGGDEPEACALQNAQDAQLHAALRALPAVQARAVVMAGIYAMSASEVAQSEGIPLGTAKTRIRLGMAKLRRALQAREVSRV
jgi:RNA polymerase sigma-70 factor (ECF subfamily)